MGIMQFQSCDCSSYCTALGKMATLILSPANCEIPVWSDDGAGNSLKADLKCTTMALVVEVTPELMESVRQAVLQNRHFTISELSVNSPRCLGHCCTKSSPGGRKTFRQ